MSPHRLSHTFGWLLLVIVLVCAVAIFGIRLLNSPDTVEQLQTAIGLEQGPPERHLIPEGYSGWVSVRYGVAGRPALETDGDVLVFRYPKSGKLETSTTWSPGVKRKEYFYDGPGGPAALATRGLDRRIWGEHELSVGDGGDEDPSGADRWSGFFVGTREEHRKAPSHIPGFFPGIEVPAPKVGWIVSDLPDEIDPDGRYLFYLHGQIVEDQGVRPVHPEFGVYEYEKILASLASEGFVVVSEARGPATDGEAYARKVVGQVEALLGAGVAPERISVVGFSKGGGIAVVVSSLLENEKVSFVFMGTCVNWIRNWPELDLKGRVLSIYESSDPIAGSCEEPFSKSIIQPEFEELGLQIGGGHGAFYRPRSEWLDPVVEWVGGSELSAGP